MLWTRDAGTGPRAAGGAGVAPRSSACDSACSCACDSESRCGRRASTSESRSSSCTCTGPSRSGSAPTIACVRARGRACQRALVALGRAGAHHPCHPYSLFQLYTKISPIGAWSPPLQLLTRGASAKTGGSASTPFVYLGNDPLPKQASAKTAAWERAAARACSACTSVSDRPVRIIGSTSAAAYGRHAPRSATASTPTHCRAPPQRVWRRTGRATAQARSAPSGAREPLTGNRWWRRARRRTRAADRHTGAGCRHARCMTPYTASRSQAECERRGACMTWPAWRLATDTAATRHARLASWAMRVLSTLAALGRALQACQLRKQAPLAHALTYSTSCMGKSA